MIEILLVIFSVGLIYLVTRFIKILKNSRQDVQKDRDIQNIDLTSQLDAELGMSSDITEETDSELS